MEVGAELGEAGPGRRSTPCQKNNYKTRNHSEANLLVQLNSKSMHTSCGRHPSLYIVSEVGIPHPVMAN